MTYKEKKYFINMIILLVLCTLMITAFGCYWAGYRQAKKEEITFENWEEVMDGFEEQITGLRDEVYQLGERIDDVKSD